MVVMDFKKLLPIALNLILKLITLSNIDIEQRQYHFTL